MKFLFPTIHGMSRTKEYQAWISMRQRCSNPKTNQYDDYGGRGISVCERWNSFELFIQDMGPRPTEKHTIERIDNDGNYTPENCRWATRYEQAQNHRNTQRVTCCGKTLRLKEWSAVLGIKHRTLRNRYDKGWPPEQILNPALGGKQVPYYIIVETNQEGNKTQHLVNAKNQAAALKAVVEPRFTVETATTEQAIALTAAGVKVEGPGK